MFSSNSDIQIVRLADWLDWAGGKTSERFIALPMIQRGSVWRPHQIIELWDSLLQGMPIGSMMVGELKEGTPVRRPGEHRHELVEAGGGLALIDGQQRTLAMLVAWPRAVEMDRRVWVDFAETPPVGQLLRLRVTTTNQPFGFRLDAPSSKFSLDDRRKAECAFLKLNGEQAKPSLGDARPFSHRPGLPVDLRQLIDLWYRRSSLEDWREKVLEILRCTKVAQMVKGAPETWEICSVWEELANKEQVTERIATLASALLRLNQLELPLIRVRDVFFETASTEAGDPLLAVLFKRIGAGGTPLSDADYVYSVIKHLRPETYDLVEGLHGGDGRDKTVASLLTATDLVMSAVRLAAVDWKPKDGKPVPDMSNPSKQDFHRLLLRGDFIGTAFLPLIQNDERESVIARYFGEVQKMLAYSGCGDTGLPKQALPLLNRPLVQVLLRLSQVGYLKDANKGRREDVLRLVLFWLIAATDPLKASRLAYEVIKDRTGPDVELGRAIHDRLIEERAAVRLPTPEDIKRLGLAFSPENKNTTKMRGESRFNINEHNQDGHSAAAFFYRSRWWRPWTHHHPILLWLQREMVAAELDKKACPTIIGGIGRGRRRVKGSSTSRMDRSTS